jgi:hypothetical protein
MTLIPNFPAATLPLSGLEQYVLYLGGVEYNTTGDDITQVITDALAAYILLNDNAVTALQGNRVLRAGDTMTGYLTANADAINALHYTTKQQMDAGLALKADATGTVLDATASGITAADTDKSTLVATTEFVSDRIKHDITKKTIVASTPYTLTEAERGIVYADHLATAPTIINLPEIATLTDVEKVEYLIVDSVQNSETNLLTINAFAGELINGVAAVTIGTNGESVYLGTAGGTSWIIQDKVAIATSTKEGTIRTATTAEAKAMTSSTIATAPAQIQEILSDTIYASEEINAAATVFTGSDGGIKYVTFSGARTIQLPDPATVATGVAFAKSIYEITNLNGTSGNTTTVTAAGGATINGLTSFVIPDNLGAGTTFVPTAAGWVTKADTSSAITAMAASVGNLDDVLSVANNTGANNIVVDNNQSIFLDPNQGGSGPSKVQWSTTHYIEHDEDGDDTMLIHGNNSVINKVADNSALTIGSNGALTIRSGTAVIPRIALNTTGAQPGYITNVALTTVPRTWSFPDKDLTIAGLADIATSVADYLNLTTGGTVLGDTTFNADLNVGYNAPGTTVSMRTATDVICQHVENTLTGNIATVIRVKAITPNAAFNNTGINVNVGNGLTNYAIDIAAGDIKLGAGTGTMIGTAAAEKLAFWGTTPVVQPTAAIGASAFVANTSGIVDDTATFGGYTMGQVVAALQQIGALA